jgi:hypothetical protein
MEQHKLLQKQIKKFLTDDCLYNPLLKNFINAVNDSYFSFERDKEIMNHAFQESEKEYQTINNSLKSEYELKKQSIANLYDSLDLIDENYAASHVDDDDCLNAIALTPGAVFGDNDIVGDVALLKAE